MSEREPIKDDGSSIDESRTELERQRDDIERRIDELQEEDAAEAYIADKIKAIELKLPKLSPSMAWQCERVVERMKTEPDVVVADEIRRLEGRKAEIERELKPTEEVKR